MRVEVAYAAADRQAIIEIELPLGSTVEQAIQASGILEQFSEIDCTRQKVGIFSQVCKLQQTIQDGDRIEIYRPLIQNPMDARRKRAEPKLTTAGI
ncbi:MAG: RnfH family protein [Methylomonas sp.]|nr:RnfH family protein [Methylomonas sp.]